MEIIKSPLYLIKGDTPFVSLDYVRIFDTRVGNEVLLSLVIFFCIEYLVRIKLRSFGYVREQRKRTRVSQASSYP